MTGAMWRRRRCYNTTTTLEHLAHQPLRLHLRFQTDPLLVLASVPSGATASVPPEKKNEIENEIEHIREERKVLAGQREEAYRRKMIMLGHLPPDDEVSLL